MKLLRGAGGVRIVPRAVVEARAQADAIRDEARREGERAGEAVARLRVVGALSAMRDEVAALACEVAGAVLREALPRDESAREALVAGALARVWRARRMVVLAHAADVDAVRALAARMGAVTALPDEARMEFRVALQGPEATEFQRAFRGLLVELVVRAPDDSHGNRLGSAATRATQRVPAGT